MEQEKSPIIAGIMAILPGMGHFYLRDTFYAILYFAIFWIAGLVTFLYLKQNGMSYVYMLGFVAIWAYGIYDAYSDCKRSNEEKSSPSA